MQRILAQNYFSIFYLKWSFEDPTQALPIYALQKEQDFQSAVGMSLQEWQILPERFFSLFASHETLGILLKHLTPKQQWHQEIYASIPYIKLNFHYYFIA